MGRGLDHSSTLTGLQPLLGTDVSGGGLDVEITKVAVDLQNLKPDNPIPLLRQCLVLIQERTAMASVFAVLLDEQSHTMATVLAANDPFTPANPEVLQGENLADWPWIAARMSDLRLLEIADTSKPSGLQRIDAARLAAMHIPSLLLVCFEVDGRPAGFLGLVGAGNRPWQADHRLLLKLLGSSLGAGLDRHTRGRELSELRERNQLATSAANDGMWDFDAVNNTLEFSPRWKAIMGFTDDDMKEASPNWHRMVHPDDLARVQARLRRHLAGETDLFESVHRMQRRDGEWRWVQCRAKALVDPQGRLQRLVGVESDITDQKIYEEALSRRRRAPRLRCSPSVMGLSPPIKTPWWNISIPLPKS